MKLAKTDRYRPFIIDFFGLPITVNDSFKTWANHIAASKPDPETGVSDVWIYEIYPEATATGWKHVHGGYAVVGEVDLEGFPWYEAILPVKEMGESGEMGIAGIELIV